MATNPTDQGADGIGKTPFAREGTRPPVRAVAVLDSITDGLLVLDSRWRCVYANAAALAFLRVAADKIVGKLIWDSFPASRYPMLHDEFTRAAEQRRFVKFEEYCEPLGRWYECRCYPSDGGLTVFLHDASDHKQIEEVLLESRQVLEMAIAGANAGLWRIDLDPSKPGATPDYVYISPQLKALIGFEDGELPNSRSAWLSRIVSEDAARLERAARDHAEGRTDQYRVDYRIRHKDGSVRWLSSRGRLYRDEYNRPIRWAGIDWDITDRKQAERTRRRSEMFARKVLASSLNGLYIYDIDKGAITFINPQYTRLTGYTLDDLQSRAGPRLLDLFHPEDRERVVAHIEASRQAGEQEVREIEYRFRTADDRWIWCLSREMAFARGADGVVHQYLGTFLDITERKEMEGRLFRLNDYLEEEVQAQMEELRETVDRLQEEVVRRVQAEEDLGRRSRMLEAFFEHTITPLAFLDRDLNFVRVNAAYAQAAGMDPEFFAGKNYFAVHPNSGDRPIFEQVVRTGRPYWAYAKPFHSSSDPTRIAGYWDWQITPLLDETGAVQYLVFNLEDVTPQQKAYHELEHRARQLQRMTLELSQTDDRERRRLADVLHDDLQQRLAAVKFQVGLLSGRAKRDAVMQATAGRIDRMLNDAIEQSRSLSHELSPAMLYQGDLGDTLTWLADQVLTKHGLIVHIRARGGVPVESDALKAFLYKATHELLFNVVKHARTREARVSLRRFGRYVCLSVSDRGRGFDPQELRETTGFGLLSIRERVALLGGRMRIHSAKGHGCTLHIIVPDARGTEDGSTPGVASPASRLRVLLADDHEIVRQGLASLLREAEDIEVVGEAANGREAVDLASRLKPNVVVVDVSMPLMNGDEAARQIRFHLPGTRVVALSMYEEEGMIEKMRRAGAEAYVLKTAPAADLLAAIRGQPRG